ncbi:MAG TPA: exodeoxyribonuclease VII small subunit [Cryomorphaceae bacterium]|nr:exodeoxyribonuclease VII small subunit [Cryomorphaceae bacterium]
MTEKSSYEDQLTELEEIIKDIEDENISVDELSSKVKRAAVLIKKCRAVLSNTEKDVADVLKDLED